MNCGHIPEYDVHVASRLGSLLRYTVILYDESAVEQAHAVRCEIYLCPKGQVFVSNMDMCYQRQS